MTNNPMIDGVSRCKTCRGSGCIDNLRSVGTPAAKCPDCTPVVERQEICGKHSGDSCKSCGGSGLVNDGELTCSSGGEPYENGPIECVKDCPECQGAQQSTIARLEARVAELESGRGEPVAWEVYWTDEDEFYRVTRTKEFVEKRLSDPDFRFVPLFTAPPAPAAVVLPERAVKDNGFFSTHLKVAGWNACLDATAALNGDKP